MMICGPQSILDVVATERIPAEDGPSVGVQFTVAVESYGFTARSCVWIEQRDARTFVSELRAVAQARHGSASLAATPPDSFQLHIGVAETGGAHVHGRLAAGSARNGHRPVLEFAFDFDPGTLATLVTESERWITTAISPSVEEIDVLPIDAGTASDPSREERLLASYRQFLAWLHIRFGILAVERHREGLPRPLWTFHYNGSDVPVNVVILPWTSARRERLVAPRGGGGAGRVHRTGRAPFRRRADPAATNARRTHLGAVFIGRAPAAISRSNRSHIAHGRRVDPSDAGESLWVPIECADAWCALQDSNAALQRVLG